MTVPQTGAQDNPVGPNLMREIGLGMADGQLEQADRLLCLPWAAHSSGFRVANGVRALEHMLSAVGWLRSAAQATVVR